MKKHTLTRRQKFILSIVILFMAVAISLAVYSLLDKKPLAETMPPAISPSSEPAKQDRNPSQETTPFEREREKPALQTETPPAVQSSSLSGTITYQSVVDGQLVIRTTIDQVLPSGTCELYMTQGSYRLTKNSSIQPNPSSSSCMGFTIPISTLATGRWAIEIVLRSNNKTGKIAGHIML